MSIQENVQIVKDAFAAIGRGDTQGLLALCAKDIEWMIPGEWPLAGTHRGHAGLAEFLQKASESVETLISQPVEFVAQGDRVLVIGFSRGSFKATNKSFEDHFVFAITVRNGQMTNIREYIDTLALARASETAAAPGPLTTETISIIGSGGMAAAIGGLAAKAGHTVEVMSRDAAKARALAEQIGAGATTGTFGAAPAGDIVILAVPYAAVLDVVKQYGRSAGRQAPRRHHQPRRLRLHELCNPGGQFRRAGDRQGRPCRCGCRQGVQHPVFPRPGRRSSRGPPTWTCSSPGTTRRRRLASWRSSRASDCARWMPGRCPWRRRWSTLCLLSLGLVTHSVKNTNFAIGVSLLG